MRIKEWEIGKKRDNMWESSCVNAYEKERERVKKKSSNKEEKIDR